MKKKFLYFVVLILLVGGFYVYTSMSSHDALAKDYCAFCDQDVLNRQKFYEDDLVIAVYSHKPVVPGHILVISKRHVERFEMLTDEEITEIGRVIKKVNQAAMNVFKTSSYLLLQKNGSDVGQTVPHVHFHYMPRQAGDDSTLKFMAMMLITNLQKPLSDTEMQNVVQELKKEMRVVESSNQ